MGIKNRVKSGFFIIIILVLLLAATNSLVLYQAKEVNTAKKNIAELIFTQEKMNLLIEEILTTNEQQELENIAKSFFDLEKQFEEIKTNKLSGTKDDFMDKFIKDLHQYPNIETLLNGLYKDETIIEEIFDSIYELKKTVFSTQYTQTVQEQIKRLSRDINKIVMENQQTNFKMGKELEILMDDFIAFITKVISTILLIVILFILYLSHKVNKSVGMSVDEIESKVHEGLKEIEALNTEISKTQREVVFTLGAIGESRSKETGNHVKRVAKHSRLLGFYYGLNDKTLQLLEDASPMHDIGKVAIADAILNKPGRFTDEERIIMNNHAQLGYEMLRHSNKGVLKAAATISYEHHEKWDGSGYPRGLKGEEIHIFGRITALADVFDALGSDRCYKKAWEDERIFALLKDERAKHFDPKLIDIFFEHLDEFLKIRDELKESIENI